MIFKMTIICPECESENNDILAGGVFGGARRCKDCGYEGIFPEISKKEHEGDEKMIKDMKKAVIKRKK